MCANEEAVRAHCVAIIKAIESAPLAGVLGAPPGPSGLVGIIRTCSTAIKKAPKKDPPIFWTLGQVSTYNNSKKNRDAVKVCKDSSCVKTDDDQSNNGATHSSQHLTLKTLKCRVYRTTQRLSNLTKRHPHFRRLDVLPSAQGVALRGPSGPRITAGTNFESRKFSGVRKTRHKLRTGKRKYRCQTGRDTFNKWKRGLVRGQCADWVRITFCSWTSSFPCSLSNPTKIKVFKKKLQIKNECRCRIDLGQRWGISTSKDSTGESRLLSKNEIFNLHR